MRFIWLSCKLQPQRWSVCLSVCLQQDEGLLDANVFERFAGLSLAAVGQATKVRSGPPYTIFFYTILALTIIAGLFAGCAAAGCAAS